MRQPFPNEKSNRFQLAQPRLEGEHANCSCEAILIESSSFLFVVLKTPVRYTPPILLKIVIGIRKVISSFPGKRPEPMVGKLVL